MNCSVVTGNTYQTGILIKVDTVKSITLICITFIRIVKMYNAMLPLLNKQLILGSCWSYIFTPISDSYIRIQPSSDKKCSGFYDTDKGWLHASNNELSPELNLLHLYRLRTALSSVVAVGIL